MLTLPSRDRGTDASCDHMDISRLREETGYAASYDVAGGVADYVQWLRAHPQ